MLVLDKIWKIISQFLGPLALICAIVFGVKQCERANKAEKTEKIITKYIETEVNFDSVRDEKDLEHAIFRSNKATREDIINNRVDSTGSVIDSIIAPLKDKIESLTLVNARLEAKLKGTKDGDKVIYKDSVIKWVFYPKTDTLDLEVDLKPSYLTYTDGTKLLGFNIGTQYLYNDIWWNDSRIKFNSINNIHVVSEVPKNTFELSAISEYRFSNQNILFGSEATLNIDRWGLTGRYLYNTNTGKTEPSAGIKFHIFK